MIEHINQIISEAGLEAEKGKYQNGHNDVCPKDKRCGYIKNKDVFEMVCSENYKNCKLKKCCAQGMAVLNNKTIQ